MSARRFVWSHPEWWVLALCASAWLPLFLGTPHRAHHHPASLSIADWCVMVTAMMAPLVIANVRVTAARSLWRRRHRAIGGFLTGYAAPWFGLGLAVAAVANGGWLAGIGFRTCAGVAFALAAAWELTPFKRQVVAACHATRPLTPDGWRADRDTVAYGCFIGSRCVAVCGLPMIGCAMAGHNGVVMLAAGGIAFWQRQTRVSERLVAVIFCGIGLAVAIA